MKQKTALYNVLTILVMAAFIVFTYVRMITLGFEDSAGITSGIIFLSMSAITIIMMFLTGLRLQNHFVILWLLWIIWMFVDFFLFGLGGGGSAGIFRVWFCPMSFLFFYMASLKTDRVERIVTLGFIVVFLIGYYLNFYNLFNFKYVDYQFGEDVGRSNLVFWCLCSLPFLLLMKKTWLQIVALLLTVFIVILTAKRTAVIAIALIMVVYVFMSMQGRNRARNIILIIVAGIALYFVISNYISGTFAGVMERMAGMQEDEGSGRIPLYRDVFSVMKENNVIDWLFGRGFGSITLSKHTNAHNDALQLLFEYGIVGLIFYIYLIIYSWRRVRILRKMKSPYFMGYVSSFIIFIMLGLVSNLVVFYSYFAFICAFWGMVEARIQENRCVRLTKQYT